MSLPETLSDSHHGSALPAQWDQLLVRVGGRLGLGLHAQFTRYGLSRDLTRPFTNPNAKIPIAVRPLLDADLAPLFSDQANDPTEKLQVAWRQAFVNKGARRGFVAVDQRSGQPCYVQWLFGRADNEFLKRLGGFPMLKDGEALLENAYTPTAFRGLGIMSAAMALIAERAADIGASKVMTFVDRDNIASLKGCARSGFYPDQLHHRTRYVFGLITRDSFEPLSPTDPRRNPA
jgi:RimJ/RimL family protein N-acetyltransferase